MAQQLAHHVLEHLVPHGMAVGVVDPLEVIDVDIDEGERHLPQFAQELLATEPVEGPGQGIVAGLLLGAAVLLGQALAERLRRQPRLASLAQLVSHQQVLGQKQQYSVYQPAQQQLAVEVPRLAPAAIELQLIQGQSVVPGLHLVVGGKLDGIDMVQIRPLLRQRDPVLLHPPGAGGEHLEGDVLDAAVIIGAKEHLVELVGGLVPDCRVGGIIIAQIEAPALRRLPFHPQLDPHAIEMGEIHAPLGSRQGQDQLTEGGGVARTQPAVDGRFVAGGEQRRNRMAPMGAIILGPSGYAGLAQDIQPPFGSELERQDGQQAAEQQAPEQQIGHAGIGWGHHDHTWKRAFTLHLVIPHRADPDPRLLHAPPRAPGIGRLSQRTGRRLPSAGLNPVGIAPQEADASSWGNGFPMSSFLSPLSTPCHGKIKKNHRRVPVYTSKRYRNTPYSSSRSAR